MLRQRGFCFQDPRRLQSLSRSSDWANHSAIALHTASSRRPASSRSRASPTTSPSPAQAQHAPARRATLVNGRLASACTTTAPAAASPTPSTTPSVKATATASAGIYMGRRAPPPPFFSHPVTSSKISSQRTSQIARHLSGSPVEPFSSTSSPSSRPLNCPKSPSMASHFNLRKVAAPNTLEHRVYIEKDGIPVSPFHDIPLYANQEQTILNMVVEIPRWTNAKLEISKEELLNPIKQDIKKGKLRYVRNCFPHKGYLWNYGAFPQTWEDPNVVHPETKAKGDNDPLDVCEIGELVGYTGQVKQVKVLGVMALLDEEETDWKVIVIDVNDPLAPKLNDIEDVERHLPGLLRATNEWFRIYKIPDGKPENQFAFTGECKNREYAMDVVRECSEAWERLITGKTPANGVSIANTNVPQSVNRLSPDQLPPLPPHQELPAEKIDSSIDKWFFISGAST
ncbi:Inorganic pyrophosphatase [Epichloe bromicola]|uniref:inorganic diphosphatase n=2 Tax=Epichloe bromicola TaxID=79588 RepID=A0ABQ0CZL8_9HYPO